MRAAIGPDDCHVLSREPTFHGAPVAAVAADTPRPGTRGARADRRRVGGARAAARPGGGGHSASRLLDEPRRYDARRRRARARRGRRRRRGRVPHADRPAQLDGDAPVGLPLGGRHARGLHLDAVHLGRARRDRRSSSACRRTSVRVVCNYMGGGFGAKNSPGDYTYIAAELAKRRPARRCAARSRAARRTSPPATATRRSSGCAPARAPTARSTALERRVRHRDRLGRLLRPDRRADADALRLRERAHARVRREAEPAAERGLPRARLRRGDVRRSSACSTSSPPSSRSTRSSCGAATTPTTTWSTDGRSRRRT